MEQKLKCEIVRDLLPSYVDGLTSEETNRAVEEHLTDCEGCSSELRRMKEPESAATPPEAEVDYLKKVRRRSTAKSLVLGIALMLLGLALISYRLFYIGSEAGETDVSCNITLTDENTLHLTGTLTSSGLAVSRVTFSESNGMVQAKVYTVPKMFFNSGDFSAEYVSQAPVGQVRVDDLIIWQEGQQIDSLTSRLFAAANPFVGDMPANERIASLLGISNQLGSYTNELQTASEPYCWTIILEQPIALEEEGTALNIMEKDSYAMLALVENLSLVNWQYHTAEGQREYMVTADDASAYADRDIKECGASVTELQGLIKSLNIMRAGVWEQRQEQEVLRLEIRCESDAEIYGLGIHYYLDGKLRGGQVYEHIYDTGWKADNTAWKRGDKVVFAFIASDFPEGASPEQLSGFSFDLFVMEGADDASTVVCEGQQIEAQYAGIYHYTLTGDSESGFALVEG